MEQPQSTLVFDVDEFDSVTRNKVSQDQFFEFQREYYKGLKRGTQHQRLGQAFYNQFDNTGKPFPHLFYMRDDEVAKALIYEKYIH